ncbi:MAG: hypothetical protein ACHQFX_04140 [Chitinophagales bacterium]
MKSELSPEIREVVEAIHYRPSVSIIMPFEPKMNARTALAWHLKLAVDTVNREIRKNYQDDLAELVIRKLKGITQNLNFSTFKRSVAIYVSPVFEKVLYLDIPVEEKIIIDESFEIRDLVFAKKEIHEYLVLILSGKESKVYIGNSTSFIKIKSNVPDHVAAYENDIAEATANFSDPSHKKEVLLKKFLQQTDHGLSYLLQSFQLPVFVLGTHKVLGYFKALTRNEKSISGYIPGNYEEASQTELRDVMNPYVNDWKKVKMGDLHHQMEKAANAGKLAAGVKDVWKLATQNRGRLLIVEKNFTAAGEHGNTESAIRLPEEPNNKYSYIKDTVDDIIEKILEHGGDVEFVDDGMLRDYGHIVLIQHY